MSAGHGPRVASTPPLTVSGVGPPRTLTGREAAIVWAVIDALGEIRGRPLGEIRLPFSEYTVDPEVSFRVRQGRRR